MATTTKTQTALATLNPPKAATQRTATLVVVPLTKYFDASSTNEPATPQGNNDKVKYTVDFSKFLGADTIASVAWNVGSDLSHSGSTNTTTTASTFIYGGTVGNVDEVVCTITSTAGQIKAFAFQLSIIAVATNFLLGPVIVQGANDKVQYVVDFSRWLDTDTVSSVAWTIDSDLSSSGSAHSTTTGSIFLYGGTVAKADQAICTATCASGQIKAFAFQLSIVATAVS